MLAEIFCDTCIANGEILAPPRVKKLKCVERNSIHNIPLLRVLEKNNLYHKVPKRKKPIMKQQMPALPQLPWTQLANNVSIYNVTDTWHNKAEWNWMKKKQYYPRLRIVCFGKKQGNPWLIKVWWKHNTHQYGKEHWPTNLVASCREGDLVLKAAQKPLSQSRGTK